jgi:hypothetical protein
MFTKSGRGGDTQITARVLLGALLYRLGAYPPDEDMPQYHASIIFLVQVLGLPVLPALPALLVLQVLLVLPSPAQVQVPVLGLPVLPALPVLPVLPVPQALPSPALEVPAIGCSQPM